MGRWVHHCSLLQNSSFIDIRGTYHVDGCTQPPLGHSGKLGHSRRDKINNVQLLRVNVDGQLILYAAYPDNYTGAKVNPLFINPPIFLYL